MQNNIKKNKNRNKNRNKNKKFNNKLNIRKLKQLHSKRPKTKKLRLNKPENVFDLSIIKSLNKPSMDKNENDASPNMDIDIDNNNNNNSICDDAKKEKIILKVSNLPTNYEPGTTVIL
eukprot:170499_1